MNQNENQNGNIVNRNGAELAVIYSLVRFPIPSLPQLFFGLIYLICFFQT